MALLYSIKKLLSRLKPGKEAHQKRLDRKELGRLGENIAFRYLKKEGWAILERNYRCPKGEIDIIAREKETVVFVEVKSQYNDVTIRIERKIDARKQKKLISLAYYYRKTNLSANTPCRIDVIFVKIKPDNQKDAITHHRHAM
mgnify:CR=1 FL=1